MITTQTGYMIRMSVRQLPPGGPFWSVAPYGLERAFFIRRDQDIGAIMRVRVAEPGEGEDLEGAQGREVGGVDSKLNVPPQGGGARERRSKMFHRRPNRTPMAIAALGIAVAVAAPVHAESAADCAARAERAARNSYGVVGGAMGGAAGGAAIGAVVSSNSRRGAKKGARIGAAVGATSGAWRRSDTYRRVYDDCMAGRYSY
jgi:hypothetical protein